MITYLSVFYAMFSLALESIVERRFYRIELVETINT